MNEEARNTENTDVVQDKQQDVAVDNSAQNLDNKLNELSSFLSKEEIASIKKEAGITPEVTSGVSDDKKDDKKDESNNDQVNPDDDKKDDKKDDAAPDDKKDDKKEDSEKKKSVFGLKKPSEKNKNDVVIENPEQLLEVVKSKFGQEYKDIKELPKFFDTAQGWRAKAEKADKFENDYNQVVDFLNSAPEELIEALKMFEKGEDYTAPFVNKPKFNFNTVFEKQDIKELVNHYFPNKFTEEDLKDENPSELLQMAMGVSKDKFIAEKQALDVKRAHVTQKAADQLKAHNLSVQSSVTHLRKVFPDTEEDIIKEVQSVFEGGPNSVLSFFYNKDGTVKPEATKMFLMAKYGEEEIGRMMDISSHITETKLNEDLVTRGADTKKPVQQSAVTDKISDKDKEKIRELENISNTSKRTF